MSIGKQKAIMMVTLLVFFLALLIGFITAGFGLTTASWIIYAILVINVVVVIVVGYTYIKITRKRIEKLPDAYKEMYFNAVDLISVRSSNYTVKKEIQDMVLEIFEHASLEERDVNEVIQGNLNDYIEQFFVDSGEKNFYLYMILNSTFLLTLFLLFMKTYKVLRYGEFNADTFKTETLDLGITLTYVIISFVFYPLLMITIKHTAEKNLTGAKRLIVVFPMLIPILLMVGLITIRTEAFLNFVDTPFILFGNIVTYIIGIVICIVFFILAKHTKTN